MTNPPNKSNVSVLLSGNMTQFTIAIGIILFALTAVTISLFNFATGYLLYFGSALLGVLFVLSIICSFVYYLRHQNRPAQDIPSNLEITTTDGKSIKVYNPPDNIYQKEELHAIMRYCMVSFDENLCPSGEVIGHASDGKFKEFTDDEKDIFKKKHIEEIKGKKNAILEMYNQPLQLNDKGPSAP